MKEVVNAVSGEDNSNQITDLTSPPESSGLAVSSPSNAQITRVIDIDPKTLGRKRSVLVVEDDPIILELLQEALSSAGFTVRVAKHALDAVEQFQRSAADTFCVILDYGIPGMHASRLLERFIEIDDSVKVILSSGYPQNFIVEDFPLERITGFMAKPYDPQILITELKRLLETS